MVTRQAVADVMRELAKRRWADKTADERSAELGRVSRIGWSNGTRPRAKKRRKAKP